MYLVLLVIINQIKIALHVIYNFSVCENAIKA